MLIEEKKRVTELSILLACHNRKNKTLEALGTLFPAIDYYNERCESRISATVFLTDDGCTDGTSEAVLNAFPSKKIRIIHSDGNAFWAGGMRMAWKEAIMSDAINDFFLLINDDTCFKRDCIIELIGLHQFALGKYGKGGVYSGFIAECGNEELILYGAKKYTKGLLFKSENMRPAGFPQECEMVNANLMLVSPEVVEKIGILDEAFIHAAADLDYGIRAKKAGFPVLVTPHVCGCSVFDHDDSDAEYQKVKAMDFKERKAYLRRPNTKQYHDSLQFYRRYSAIKYVLFGLSYYLNLFVPSFYYRIYKKRGH